jgi:hypothetical protein
MSLDNHRREQIETIERIVKEVSNVVAAVKSVAELTKQLHGESKLFGRLSAHCPIGIYQNILKNGALWVIHDKECELQREENEERKRLDPKIGQD